MSRAFEPPAAVTVILPRISARERQFHSDVMTELPKITPHSPIPYICQQLSVLGSVELLELLELLELHILRGQWEVRTRNTEHSSQKALTGQQHSS